MRMALKKGCILEGALETCDGTKKNGKFTIKKFLGEGGIGLVYLCSGDDNKNYAIKELYPKELENVLKRNNNELRYNSLASVSSRKTFEWYKNNLKREVNLCQKATISRCLDNNDPFYLNCIGILTLGETSIYAVYETYEGRTLLEYFDEFKSQVSLDYTKHLIKMLTIIAIAAHKLHHIHKNNILHLDITPANLFLIDYGYGYINEAEGEIPCFLDFGNAYAKGETLAKNHRFSFSEGYSAPELLLQSKDNTKIYKIGEGTDTYSLTAILYEALIGEKYDDPLKLISFHSPDWRQKLEIYPEMVHRDLYWLFEERLRCNYDYDAEELADRLWAIRSKLVDNNEDINVSLFHWEKKLDQFSESNRILKELSVKVKEIEKAIHYDFHGGKEDEKYANLDIENTSAAELCKIGKEYRNKNRYVEAKKYFELAYNKGDVEAGGYLGFAYGSGQGSEINKKLAMDLILEACQKGDTGTKYALGLCYYLGGGLVKRNYKKAVKLFKEVAACENCLMYNASLMNLGNCYKNGHGVWKNKNKALLFYKKAADRGHKPSQRALENMLKSRKHLNVKR